MLREEFLEPLGMTQSELAKRIGVPFQRVNSLVNGRRNLTPDTALRLSKLFGTSAAFWMNHQLRWDLFFAQRAGKEALASIRPYRHPKERVKPQTA
jgi:addiction module HigA family antidote